MCEAVLRAGARDRMSCLVHRGRFPFFSDSPRGPRHGHTECKNKIQISLGGRPRPHPLQGSPRRARLILYFDTSPRGPRHGHTQ